MVLSIMDCVVVKNVYMGFYEKPLFFLEFFFELCIRSIKFTEERNNMKREKWLKLQNVVLLKFPVDFLVPRSRCFYLQNRFCFLFLFFFESFYYSEWN